MSSGHGHLHDDAPPLHVGRGARTVVLGVVALCAVAALVAVALLWPSSQRVARLRGLIPFAAKGYVLVHGEVLDVRTACTGKPRTGCGDSRARVLDGRNAGRTVAVSLYPDVVATGVRAGDRVLLFDSTAVAGAAGGAGSAFSFYRVDRAPPLLFLLILFAVAVVAVALRRGLMALVGLAFSGLVVVGWLIPALLSGRPAIPVVLAASVLMLVVILYSTHGLSMRTSVAVVGAMVGIGLSTLFAWVGIDGARIGGLGDESAGLLVNDVPSIDVQQLIVASVILAGVGTLNDVTVTQASALWELRAASPRLSRLELFRAAMRIGRDHVASTVYTLVFAYLGTALVLIVAVQLYGGGPIDFATAEDVAEEIVRALVGGIALVLAMPVTTAIGALVVATAEDVRPPAVRPSRAPGPRRSTAFPPTTDGMRRLPADPWSER